MNLWGVLGEQRDLSCSTKSSSVAPGPSFPYQTLTESDLSFDYVAYSMEQVAVRVSSKQPGKSEQNLVTRAASTFQTGENDREKEV